MSGILALALALLLTEPAARRLTAVPLRVDSPFAHVSAVHELRDGRLVVTDALHPAVYVLAPGSGTTTRLGSVGTGPGQYITPGGLYAAAGDTIFLIDRGMTRLVVVTPDGALGAARSIAQRGHTSASDADVDRQRLDARGLVYFADRSGGLAARLRGGGSDSLTVLRLDAATQRVDTVARLRAPERTVQQAGDNMTFSRSVVGSPADGWGVAPDGRVAVVRAVPYRVDWYSPTGRITRGPSIAYDPEPMTDADKAAFRARSSGGTQVGVSGTAGSVSANDIPITFASTKPPFDPTGVLVTPAGRVWVKRNGVLGAPQTVYDVFDGAGRRVDRVSLPAGARIVGFGASAVYVSEGDGPSSTSLAKYRL